ncbi:MAG TPA: aminopeptidase P family protein [Actinomycetota bacterium]|nr:aminopeptidase P family protein [Actinomycetota bacterium]
MDHEGRRKRLAERLPELGVEAFLVTRLPNVRYLTGFTGSNGQLLLTPDGGVFLTDGRYTEQARREVPDLRRGVYSGEFARAFATACTDLGVRRVAFEAAGLTYKAYTDLAATGVELVPTVQEVERLRWVKDPDELALVEAAQDLTDRAFEEVLGRLAEGVTERELALELDCTMRRLGAQDVAFDTIVAFGESAAEPHHRPSDRPLRRGDVVKLDFGCVFEGYHSDMTRTVALGEPHPTLREVYEVVRQAQRAGVEAVRAGATGGEVDRAAREVIREAGYGDRFSHSLGHGVGLEIHEGPTLRHEGSDVLPEGAVVTVEPGVYLEGLGGVRIEDMVVVTGDGCRVLPRAPKDLIIL